MQVSSPVRFGVLTLVGLLAAGLLWLGVNRYQAEQRAAESAARDLAERTAAPQVQPAAVEPAAEKPEREPMFVHVAGAVKNPGVYQFEEGARVADAITLAGGASPEGDPSELNLAERLTDGAKIYVRTKAEVQNSAPSPPAAQSATVMPTRATSGGSSPSAQAPAGKVNINTASKAQLEALSGIGPATADRIIAERATKPFKDLNDLKTRGKVQERYLNSIKDKVVF